MSVLEGDNIEVKKIAAITLTVSNADYIKDFYEQALGFKCIDDIFIEGQKYSLIECISKAKIRVLTLQLGEEKIKLMHYLNDQDLPIPKDSRSNDIWFQHLAIVVKDIDLAYTHLKSFSVEHISIEPQTIPQSNEASGGVRAFKFKDPDGHNLELIWFPADKGKKKWHEHHEQLFLGIDHSAIAVSNTEQSLEFYQNLLGLKTQESSLNTGKTQARLDGLFDAQVRVTSLGTIEKGIGIELLDYIVPSDGRPRPENWTSTALGYLQLELVVNNLKTTVEQLEKKGVKFISPHLIQLKKQSNSYEQACLIQDPDGHALLLLEEKK
ncbi:VOC family protein [Gloeothece verrucosa]|uniref:Glyoxalase/bleomycin resistance protein/dioxygenase n=1 Tax=Gloeothece verrucosa (strain PCC 7822) TaxID=497965 RepID=E0UKS1_GLOV7|nr:VOC family protein [Gloeothece verrucosa]ADN17551.1 Glyoxalase/bleomycin resistance protein/dioxygenase [Gloeothece verrucosa PCC 7822]